MRWGIRVLLACGGFVTILGATRAWLHSQESRSNAQSLVVTQTQNASRVPRYEVFELTFEHDNQYANPFFEAEIDVVFTSPSARAIRVGGFHYGSLGKPEIRVTPAQGRGANRVEYLFDRADVWKARFAPAELGQ